MQSVDNHYQLTDLLKKKPEQNKWLKKAYDLGLPVAINAYGIFAQPATVLADGRMALSGEVRMIKRGWLYIDPDALLGLLYEDSIEVGMFGSSPKSDLDTWATRKAGEKIRIRRDELWIHEGSLPLVDDLITSDISDHRPERVRATTDASSKRIETERRKQEREEEIEQIREMAVDVATKLKTGGMAPRYITQARICEDLLERSFSSGKPVKNRWGTIEGIRAQLKNDHNPKKSARFLKAKSTRGKFNA